MALPAPAQAPRHPAESPAPGPLRVDNLFAGVWLPGDDGDEGASEEGSDEAGTDGRSMPCPDLGHAKTPAAAAAGGNDELLDTSAVRAAGSSLLPPPPAGPSGRLATSANGGSGPAETLTLANPPSTGPKKAAARTEWAVRGGVADLDGEFERLRPNLAHHFPFELDRFQKEAVVHLERVRPNAVLGDNWGMTNERVG